MCPSYWLSEELTSIREVDVGVVLTLLSLSSSPGWIIATKMAQMLSVSFHVRVQGTKVFCLCLRAQLSTSQA